MDSFYLYETSFGDISVIPNNIEFLPFQFTEEYYNDVIIPFVKLHRNEKLKELGI